MPQITLLSQETIDKIAAGEVVERPSSVVKELVENAIDAKATAVTVEIREGGISFIRITDNGCGIEREQVPLAFLRHSTSKIKRIEDLLCIKSLGFRGEALSSIAAVSQVELITKTCSEMSGTRYVIEGSKELANEEIGAPDGTTFLVRNLFYNTPARRKFLKSAVTEGNYINDLMERLALSHPDVSFKFINNGQNKLHTSGNSVERDIIYHIYGRDITAALLPVQAQTEHFSVTGFVGKPVASRGNRNFETFFINGRYIRSALLTKAVEDAYKGYLMQRQYPFCVLYFTMDADTLDVNVHPAKMELRFLGNEEIYSALCRIVRDALSEKEFIPEVPLTKTRSKKPKPVSAGGPEPFERHRLRNLRERTAAESPYERKYPQREAAVGISPPKTEETKSAAKPENLDVFEKLLYNAPRTPELRESGSYTSGQSKPDPAAQAPAESAAPAEEQPTPQAASGQEMRFRQETCFEQQAPDSRKTGFFTADAAKRHRIIGQLFETYWLIEYEDKLFVIDQHAAHEKVLYERTMARVREKDFVSQNISPPVILTLSAAEQEMLGRYGAQIAAFGYEIAPFGGREFAINAVPADFESIDVKAMFTDMLDEFSGTAGHDAPEQILEKVASMSCRAAVKGNTKLSRPEAEALIDELLSLENPYHCPHGRPTIISMTKQEIEKKFKRIV